MSYAKLLKMYVDPRCRIHPYDRWLIDGVVLSGVLLTLAIMGVAGV